MPRENVEIVQRGWDAWIAGEIEALFAEFDAAVEWGRGRALEAVGRGVGGTAS